MLIIVNDHDDYESEAGMLEQIDRGLQVSASDLEVRVRDLETRLALYERDGERSRQARAEVGKWLRMGAAAAAGAIASHYWPTAGK